MANLWGFSDFNHTITERHKLIVLLSNGVTNQARGFQSLPDRKHWEHRSLIGTGFPLTNLVDIQALFEHLKCQRVRSIE